MGKSDACTATGYQAKEKTMESDWNQTVSKEKTLTHSHPPQPDALLLSPPLSVWM